MIPELDGPKFNRRAAVSAVGADVRADAGGRLIEVTQRPERVSPHASRRSGIRNLPVSLAKFIQRFLEAVGVRAFGFGQRFEPVGDLVEAFFARGLGHVQIHVGVFVSLAGDR